MHALFSSSFAASLVPTLAGAGFAVSLLAFVLMFCISAGWYYSVPRAVLKWISRQAIAV
jgi:hypothetical protein